MFHHDYWIVAGSVADSDQKFYEDQTKLKIYNEMSISMKVVIVFNGWMSFFTNKDQKFLIDITKHTYKLTANETR